MAYGVGPNLVRDGLVLYLDAANPKSYPGSGTHWNDLTGGGNGGTLVNGVGYTSDNGGAMVFDGVDDWLNIPNADRLVKGKTQLSMGVMVKFTSLTFLGVIIGVPRYNCTKNIVITAFENGNITFYNDNLVTCLSISLSSYIELNKWIYIVGTFNGTTTSLYAIKDNILSSASGTLVTGTTNDFNDYNVFGVMGKGANYLGGELSSAFVYDKALTPQEILQNYNATKSRFNL
jgi:hypothetical protein